MFRWAGFLMKWASHFKTVWAELQQLIDLQNLDI